VVYATASVLSVCASVCRSVCNPCDSCKNGEMGHCIAQFVTSELFTSMFLLRLYVFHDMEKCAVVKVSNDLICPL